MKRGKWIAVLCGANVALLAVSVLYALFFLDGAGDGKIVCLFKETLHAYCPGCGGTRAVGALLRFDFVHSFIYNPTVLVTAVIFLDIDLRALVSVIKGDPRYLKSFPSKIFFVIPAVILINFVVRNILLFGFGIDLLGDILKG